MNAVGIDVSKGKSMVAALRPMGEVALLPQEFLHTEVGLEQMAYAIVALGEDTRVIMEATGRYHEPIAAALHEYGIYVCVLNPLFIKQSGGGSIRKVKTDKADAMKIAKYGLDNWVELREYTPMDTVRQQLKLCSRQYNLYMKTVESIRPLRRKLWPFHHAAEERQHQTTYYHSGAAASIGQDDAGRTARRDDAPCKATAGVRYRAGHVRRRRNDCCAAHGGDRRCTPFSTPQFHRWICRR